MGALLFLNLQAGKKIYASNPDDFKKLYNLTMEMLFKISYRIVEDKEVAQDLAHESLIKMHEKNGVFPSFDDAKYWLIRVVKNASLNYTKRKFREQKAFEKVFREDSQKTDSGEVVFLKDESKKHIQKMIERLPERFRVALILKEYSKLTYKEMGKVLGITENNAKVRIYRARQRLLKFIGEEDVYMS
ncbi:MAG: RNA polymerase sigma factor [Treponemataceae bacterium]